MKSCFVICPIGDEGSKERRQSDCLFEYIVKPALDGLGYQTPVRVDKEDKPTHITTSIVTHLVQSDLVIADLSSLNANVFYELGIRHAHKKPCIHLFDWELRLPFDLGHVNAIKYTHDDPNSHRSAIERIREQISAFNQEPNVSNPVTVALGFARLSEEGDTKDRLLVSMSEKLELLVSEVRIIRSGYTRERIAGALLEAENQRSYLGSNALRAYSFPGGVLQSGAEDLDKSVKEIAEILTQRPPRDKD